MKLIKSHNESIAGNEAIKQINIERVSAEIADFRAAAIYAFQNLNLEEMDYLEVKIEDLEDILESLEN